jgi:hypothetical protein
MSDYSKKSWKDLKRCLETSPVETPDYIKAKEERDHRIKLYGLIIAAAGIAAAVIMKILLK